MDLIDWGWFLGCFGCFGRQSRWAVEGLRIAEVAEVARTDEVARTAEVARAAEAARTAEVARAAVVHTAADRGLDLMAALAVRSCLGWERMSNF